MVNISRMRLPQERHYQRVAQVPVKHGQSLAYAIAIAKDALGLKVGVSSRVHLKNLGIMTEKELNGVIAQL